MLRFLYKINRKTKRILKKKQFPKRWGFNIKSKEKSIKLTLKLLLKFLHVSLGINNYKTNFKFIFKLF